MPPPKDEAPPHAIDRTPEYNEFMEKLKEYHAKRGTVLDPEPKVGVTQLDLLKVFKHIVDNGGYDKVSDEKLAWRRMAAELGLYSTNVASTAFALKEKFYKNLAAYEISTVHKQEPPPKEILEDVSAKGAALLTRTLENFRGIKRDSNVGVDSGDDATPAKDKTSTDTPGSSARASRGLREAPPQRVIFQPDTGSSRTTTRQSTGPQASHANSPAATPHTSHPPPNPHPTSAVPLPPTQSRAPRGASSIHTPQGSEHVSTIVGSYEPRLNMPIPLRPVDTPGNNPNAFPRRKAPTRTIVDVERAALARAFEGPNIYTRCLNALRSGIPAEQAYALFHLVKISYERGDKYKFDAFPGLAEGLIDKALEVGSLFFRVQWRVSWSTNTDFHDINVLNGYDGTRDILDRIASLDPVDVSELLQPVDFSDQIVLINEATLTIRNMMTLPENAAFMSGFLPLKDLICIILHLPKHEAVVELEHLALDIAEQLTPNIVLDADDPLYTSLLGQLDSSDRGTILTALRALGRISMNLEATNRLGHVPPKVLQRISEWLLLNDDELMDACLDFLYQYTAVVSNVDNLVRSTATENLVHQLVRLLAHGAKRVQRDIILVPERSVPAKEEIAPIPQDLLQDLLKIGEPDRVHQWIRSFFEEDKDSFVTQLAAWQAYQNGLAAALKSAGQAQITPADFIRNCTNVYKDSKAQVLKEPGEMQQKFIIQGIRARPFPVSINGREYRRCMWASESGTQNESCGHFAVRPEHLWNHILTVHLKQPRGESGFANKQVSCACRWGECSKYAQPAAVALAELARHVDSHVSALWPRGTDGQSKRPVKSWVVPAKTMTVTYEETMTTRDERNPNAAPQAAGIPLSAVLVLRNIARNVVKTDAEEELLKQHELGGEGGGWNERLFRPLLPRLFEILAENRALSPYVSSLLDLIHQDQEQ